MTTVTKAAANGIRSPGRKCSLVTAKVLAGIPIARTKATAAIDPGCVKTHVIGQLAFATVRFESVRDRKVASNRTLVVHPR